MRTRLLLTALLIPQMLTRYYLALVLSLLLSLPLAAQSFHPVQIRDDLHFLQKALYRGHPGVFHYTPRDSMDALFDRLRAEVPTDSVSQDQVHILVRRAVAAVRDGHTSVLTPFYNEQTRVMPIMAQIVGNQVFVWRNYSGDTTLRRGLEIRSINGIPAAEILRQCRELCFRDGFNLSFPDVIASVSFARFVRLLYGDVDRYHLETISSAGETRQHDLAAKSRAEIQKLQEISARETPPRPASAWQPVLRNRNVSLLLDTARKDIAVLKMGGFPSRGYRKFYRKAFRWLDVNQMGVLVIDLRNNTGGDIRNMDCLVSHIADQPFEYNYVRNRHTHMGRYFRFRAKTIKAMVWAKYNLQPGFCYRRIDGKHTQKWRVKPIKRRNFNGKTFVLTNGWSFSSASVCASFLKNKTGAILIGSETGGSETSNCGGGFPKLILPNSRISIRFPLFQLRYQLGATDTGHGVLPKLPTPYRIEDLLSGRDLEMDEVFKAIPGFK